MGDFEFDEAFVRSLLEEQHPDLAGLELRRVEGGWDNQMWRLGDDLAVRLPRTPRAPALLRKEHRWLPELVPRLPLPVPIPVRAGDPSKRFPNFWTVTTWVAGEPADRAPVGRMDAAETLAAFLKALHRPAPADAPADPHRGVALSVFAEDAGRRFGAMSASGEDTADLEAVWNDALTAPEWSGPPLWLHADLHPANVVVEDRTLSGVLDFGDLCTGDPATDLAAAWLLLPTGAARRFFAAYADADEATVRRARGWALMKCLALIEIGRAGDLGLTGGKPTWGPAGRAALERLPVFDPTAPLPSGENAVPRHGGAAGPAVLRPVDTIALLRLHPYRRSDDEYSSGEYRYEPGPEHLRIDRGRRPAVLRRLDPGRHPRARR